MLTPYNHRELDRKWNGLQEDRKMEKNQTEISRLQQSLLLDACRIYIQMSGKKSRILENPEIPKEMKEKSIPIRDYILDYGWDALCIYCVSAVPPGREIQWDDYEIEGAFRFLGRIWRMALCSMECHVEEQKELAVFRSEMIAEMTWRMDQLRLNTAVSWLMKAYKRATKLVRRYGGLDRKTLETWILLLAPFAPNLSQELWKRLGNEKSVFENSWPLAEEKLLEERVLSVPVQLNGKVQLALPVFPGEEDIQVKESAKKAMMEMLLSRGRRAEWENLDRGTYQLVYVPGTILNYVFPTDE